MKILAIAATAVLAAAVLASPLAMAHATLKNAEPAAGAALSAAPAAVTLTFNEKLAAAFSTITVSGPDGQPVAGKATVDDANPAILRMPLPALPAGAYSVKWAVAGPDGHRRTGSYAFTVK